VKLFLKNSNLCDHNSPTSQTDRQTTCDRNTALCTKVHRAVKTDESNYTSYGKLIHRSLIIITSYAVPVAVAVLTTV